MVDRVITEDGHPPDDSILQVVEETLVQENRTVDLETTDGSRILGIGLTRGSFMSPPLDVPAEFFSSIGRLLDD